MSSKMEAPPPDPRSKRTLRRTTTPPNHHHHSMSDSDNSTAASQDDSYYSPLRFESPDPDNFNSINTHTNKNTTKSVTSFDRYYSPSPGPSPPAKSNLPATSPGERLRGWRPWQKSEKQQASESGNNNLPSSVVENRQPATAVMNNNRQLVKDDHHQMQVVKKVGGGGGALEEGYAGARDGGEGMIVLRNSSEKTAVRKAALVFRVFEMAVCLISFSIMAKDKTQGWSGDSFDRYFEYRYCLGVNIMGFIYSGLQALVLICHMSMGKNVVASHLRFHFDFSMDQILAYLVLSASCCAATRVTDWISNWGKDEFTLLASASIAMSFLAFIAFAISSLISGYNLCSRYLS